MVTVNIIEKKYINLLLYIAALFSSKFKDTVSKRQNVTFYDGIKQWTFLLNRETLRFHRLTK
jgi:hypothetical protein